MTTSRVHPLETETKEALYVFGTMGLRESLDTAYARLPIGLSQEELGEIVVQVETLVEARNPRNVELLRQAGHLVVGWLGELAAHNSDIVTAENCIDWLKHEDLRPRSGRIRAWGLEKDCQRIIEQGIREADLFLRRDLR